MANMLLVDASPLIYSNYNAMKRFKTKAGVPTGLRFGFMRSMRSYVEKTEADRVAICLDLPGKVKKAEGVSEYKANRGWTPEKEEMYEQVPDLLELLSYTRYALVSAVGYEADDVLAHLARKFSAKNHRVYIVSSDNDLLQLVNEKIRIWMPPKKENKNKPWFKDEGYCVDQFGVFPEHLLFYRALTGDTSDNLKGCVPKKWHKDLAEHFRKLERDASTRDVCAMIMSLPAVYVHNDWMEVFEKNMEVMRLHDPAADELKIEKGKKDPDSLRKAFYTLEMKSLVPHVGKFTGVEEPGLGTTEA